MLAIPQLLIVGVSSPVVWIQALKPSDVSPAWLKDLWVQFAADSWLFQFRLSLKTISKMMTLDNILKDAFIVFTHSRYSKAIVDRQIQNHNIRWSTTSPAPLPLTQNPEAVRAGNYRDCFVNQAHPWLLLVNSHTHPWNSWKRTLLVWLCRSAYCNYVAFNCALLTPSDWDALWPGTEMSLLFVDLRLVGIVCVVYKGSFFIVSLCRDHSRIARKGGNPLALLQVVGPLEF